MTTPHNLDELAARVEAATGPDRELDRDIAEALLFDFVDGWIDPPDFSSSLDAAMTLVPEEFTMMLYTRFRDYHAEVGWPGAGNAATPALALTAACLRARASLTRGEAERTASLEGQ